MVAIPAFDTSIHLEVSRMWGIKAFAACPMKWVFPTDELAYGHPF
jgi:hypothetical protein